MRKPIKLITSFFYLGHSPWMPGTLGSLAGLGAYLLIRNNIVLYAFSIIFLFTMGMLFTAEAEKVYKRKDARMIVIDEACGMQLALFLVPYNTILVIIGFFLFRILDIMKPPPAKKIETFSGAYGIMFDDIIAAIYTNLILQVISRLFNIY